MLSPSRGSKPKRSYLDKGPTKEQVERRNLLKGKLAFGDDDEEDSGAFSLLSFQEPSSKKDDGDIPLENEPRRSRSTIERMSVSLSPKMLRRRVLGKTRGERNDATTNERTRERKNNTTSTSTSTITGSTTTTNDKVSTHNNNTKSRWATSEEGRSSLSPRHYLKRSVFTIQGTKKETDLDDMRQSLIADKKQLDKLEKKFHSTPDDDDAPDDETLLERVARRVVARRGKLNRTKTEGDDIESMQQALKRRQAMEREEDEEIGGLWAMGLKALERVYDDINNTKRDYDNMD